MNGYGLLEIEENVWVKKRFYIYEGDASMKNWIGIVEFKGRVFTITPFRKDQSSFTEQLEITRLCVDKANELWP